MFARFCGIRKNLSQLDLYSSQRHNNEKPALCSNMSKLKNILKKFDCYNKYTWLIVSF